VWPHAYRIALSALCFVGAAAPICAQDAGVGSSQTSKPVPTFETEVVVTAERADENRERLATSTSVLTGAQLELRPATTLGDAVHTLPGFQILSADASGIAPAAIARGFFGGGEAEYVKVLWNGIPLEALESGLVDWRQVPLFAVERVEATRGPASAVYGDAALGGVVQVFTRTPETRSARVTGFAGSFGSASAGIEFGQPIGSVSAVAIGSYHRSEGARSRSGLEEGLGSVSFQHSSGGRQWSARGYVNYSQREEPGALTGVQLLTDRTTADPLFAFDREHSRRSSGAMRYGLTAGRLTSSAIVHISHRSGDRLRTLLLAPGLSDRAHRDVSTLNLTGAFENSLATSFAGVPGDLRFGADLSRSALDTRYRAVSNSGVIGGVVGTHDGGRSQLSGYATQSLDVGTRAIVHAGSRWDVIRDRDADQGAASHSAWSPRLGAVVRLGARTSLFAQASRAFKAPTLDQLFDPRPFPDFRGGTFLVSNAALRPQRAVNVEGGLRGATPRYRWEAVVYRMKVRDEIDFDPATFTYANIGRSTHDGVEVDVELFRASAIRLSANYGWTRVFSDAAGPARRQLKNIPRHLVRPDVTIMLPRGLTINARYTHSAGAYADDDNQVPLGGRSTIDARVAKRFAKLVARLDVLNLNDDRYEEVGYVLPDFRGGRVPFFYPAPGTAIRAGLEVNFR